MMKLKPEIILAIIIAIFFIIELKGVMHYDNADENIYFYMGKLITEGKTPYVDFFYAHPPLKIYVSAFIIAIFGVNMFMLKLVPLLSIIIAAVFLFKLMKSEFGSAQGIAASTLFLTSFTVMSESTYATGINLTVMLAVAGLYFVYAKKYFTAGILAGFAGLAGLYSLVYVPVIAAFLFFSSRKDLIRYLAGFSLIFVSINLLFLLISNGTYFVSVYKYHLLKPQVEGNTFRVFWDVIAKSPILFALAAIFALNYTKKLKLVVLISISYIVFLLLLSRIFNFYFMLVLPLLAMLGAYTLVHMAEITKMRTLVLSLIFSLLAISAILTTSFLFNFDFVNFQASREMASFVMENSPQNATLFGDDTATPLVAMFSERKIAYDMVDTNYMVFGSGVVSLQDTIQRIREEPPTFVIIRPLYNIGAFPEFKKFLNEECTLIKHFRDPQWADFVIYDCAQS